MPIWKFSASSSFRVSNHTMSVCSLTFATFGNQKWDYFPFFADESLLNFVGMENFRRVHVRHCQIGYFFFFSFFLIFFSRFWHLDY